MYLNPVSIVGGFLRLVHGLRLVDTVKIRKPFIQKYKLDRSRLYEQSYYDTYHVDGGEG